VAASDKRLGRALVLGPNEGKSYWQPVPANGFARNLFNDETTGSVHKYSLSVQTIAPGCFIREHTHDHNDEAAYVVAGKGFFRSTALTMRSRPVRRCSSATIAATSGSTRGPSH
jgi:uncharacterized cupin superfamily protein